MSSLRPRGDGAVLVLLAFLACSPTPVEPSGLERPVATGSSGRPPATVTNDTPPPSSAAVGSAAPVVTPRHAGLVPPGPGPRMKDFHYNDFRQTHARWEAQPPVSQAPGLTPLDDGLDVLVALRKVGKTVIHRLDVLRFDQPSLDRTLVAWSNQADDCDQLAAGIHTGRAELVGSRKADVDGDGHTDLVVRIEAHAGRATQAMMARCDAHADGKAPNPALSLPRKTFELSFSFDGEDFTADDQQLQAFSSFLAGPRARP